MNNVQILFEDKNIIACIKPRGYSSEDGQSPNMAEALTEMTGCKEIKTLHRLDVGVCGVMVYAKNKTAAAKMSALIAEGKMTKQYHALVHGIPSEKQGRFEDLLFKDSRKNKVFVVDKERKGVKRAALCYNVLKEEQIDGQMVSLVEITLETGRSHQIRVQFASRKHPLCGDGKYGAKDRYKSICLASTRISFVSPFDGKLTVFENTQTDFDI